MIAIIRTPSSVLVRVLILLLLINTYAPRMMVNLSLVIVHVPWLV